MNETGLTLLTDENYQDFIKDGVSVVLVSLILPNEKECPYCIKLKAKLENLTHRKIGTITINNASKFKSDYFKTLESGKNFPVVIVFENGIEKYRRAGDTSPEVIEDFIDNGTQPPQRLPMTKEKLFQEKGQLITQIEISQSRLKQVNDMLQNIINLGG